MRHQARDAHEVAQCWKGAWCLPLEEDPPPMPRGPGRSPTSGFYVTPPLPQLPFFKLGKADRIKHLPLRPALCSLCSERFSRGLNPYNSVSKRGLQQTDPGEARAPAPVPAAGRALRRAPSQGCTPRQVGCPPPHRGPPGLRTIVLPPSRWRGRGVMALSQGGGGGGRGG